jgi:aconitate hydratase
MGTMNTFKIFLKDLEIDGETYHFYDIAKLGVEKYDRLPYCIRVLFESAVRNCDEFIVTSKDVKNILNWPDTQHNEVEIPFLPSRVILQDFT